MIRTEALSFAYEPNREPLFSNVDVSVKGGEILSILGRNGIGKTTLLKCMLGLHQNYGGTIERVQTIGYVPQKIFAVFNMPALEMIVMGRMPHIGLFGMPGPEDYAIARKTAEQVGIADLMSQSFNDLSGGQKQMVLIARALCMEPQAVIFDEPLSALDYNNQNRVLKLIRTIAGEGMSVIFTTHDPTHAVHVSDKALLLQDSKTSHFGRNEEVLNDRILREVYEIPLFVHPLQENRVVNPLYDS